MYSEFILIFLNGKMIQQSLKVFDVETPHPNIKWENPTGDFLRSHLLCCAHPTFHPKVITGNGQLTRGAITINDFLRNSQFSPESSKTYKSFSFTEFAEYKCILPGL